jgi:hypothetical protein
MKKEENTTVGSVLQKIKQDKVTPIARWHFVLRNSTFWTFWGLSVVLGACAVAATIFVFLNAGWGYRSITHDSSFKFILDVVPLLWIVSIGIMAAFGYYNIRHTDRGYRFSFYLVVIASIIISFIGGTVLYTIGIAGDIDNIRKPLPFSDPIMRTQESRWNDKKRGLVLGTIKDFDTNLQTFSLVTTGGKEKVFSTLELQDHDIALIKEGEIVRVIQWSDGQDPEILIACAVLPRDLRSPIKRKKNFERNIHIERINKCKDVRPYTRYREIMLITN